MPRFEITAPDGAKYQVDGPDGATEQDALAQVQKQMAPSSDSGPTPTAAPTSAGAVDEYGRSQTPMAEPPAASGALARIVQAGARGAEEGFGNPIGQTMLTPEAQDWLDAKHREDSESGILAGVGSGIGKGLGTVGGVLTGTPNAAIRGAQAAIAQTGRELPSPSLGDAGTGTGGLGGYLRESLSSLADPALAARDVGGLMEQKLAESGFSKGVPGGAAASVPSITAREVQARDGVGIMEAWQRAHAENRAAARPAEAAAVADIGAAPDINSAIAAAGKAVEGPAGEAIPTVTVTAPRPLEPVGAAASRDLAAPADADISTADMKANRRRAEMDEIIAPPAPGDTMIHVPGSFPTLAEYSGDPVVSQYENLLRQRNPGDFIGEGKRLTENNKARVDHYDINTVPDPVINTMRKDRTTRWTAASDDILPNAKPVDLTPVQDWVNKQLDNRRIQETDAIRSVLEDFRDRLTDSSGELKTNPGNAWGIHDNLQNQLAKAKDPLNMTGAEKFAEKELLEAKTLIDKALNVATDNKFQSALDQYAEDSKPINAAVLFNNFRPQLTNMSGELQPVNFRKFVIGLAKERGDPGIDPSMDITDQGMRSMLNIYNDLKRAGLIKVGAPNTSPTNLLGALAQSAGLDAAHSALRAVPFVGPVMSAGQKLLAQRKLIADTAKHLSPPEGGYKYFVPDESMPEPPP